jgi:hypothetical protein
MRVALGLAWLLGLASAGAQPLPPAIPAPFPIPTPWTTTSCWIEPRWFETLRDGPVDFCKRSLRFRPGKIDCLAVTDEVCWAFNQLTGEWTTFRTASQPRQRPSVIE